MTHHVPFLDLRASYEALQGDLDAAALRVLRSGWYIGGAEVEAFEQAFARYCDVGHCIAVANGLEALQLALAAAGVGQGDEVIVPAHTFIATWLAVTECGAVPVPVEVDARTYNLDPDRLTDAITPRTRAVVPVHLYGQPAALDAILGICEPRGIAVVEDAAQAHGARTAGRRIGGHGVAAAWSFYPGKNLGAFGDAGAITTNDADLAARLRMLRNYGSSVRYVHRVQGRNSRLDPIQAALLGVKLAHLDEWNARRRAIAARYLSALAGTGVVLPEVPAWADPVWHLFCVRHSQRDALRLSLEQAGVETLIHYPIPPHLQDAYAAMRLGPGAFPIAEETASTILSLPIGPAMTGAQVDRVIEAVTAAAPA
ncbi:MAG: DegT/DnrJ/EryC1/StrS family aminotransferase [Minisyncoccota bacterium]